MHSPIQDPSLCRILVCDDISDVGLDVLGDAGYDVQHRAGISRKKLLEEVGQADVLMVRSRTRVNRQLLSAAGRLRLVARAGFPLDTIDVAEATRRGVAVLHSPTGNEVAAAEFTIGLLFSLARQIPQAAAYMRDGRWEKRRLRGVELAGKTLGVLGMGAVGRNVVERAVALKMKVKVHDPAVSAKEVARLGAKSVSWNRLLPQCDFITVHVSPSERTRGLIGDAAFEHMKDRVRIINCSRGGVVDEDALVRAIRSGKVAGAAVDAWDEEPPTGNPLLEMQEVICTPHLVATTFEAQINVAVRVANQVQEFLSTGQADDVVNADELNELEAVGS